MFKFKNVYLKTFVLKHTDTDMKNYHFVTLQSSFLEILFLQSNLFYKTAIFADDGPSLGIRQLLGKRSHTFRYKFLHFILLMMPKRRRTEGDRCCLSTSCPLTCLANGFVFRSKNHVVIIITSILVIIVTSIVGGETGEPGYIIIFVIIIAKRELL